MDNLKNYILKPTVNKKEAQLLLKKYFNKFWCTPYTLKKILSRIENIEGHFLHFILYDVELNYKGHDKEIRTQVIKDLLIHNSKLLSNEDYEKLLPINITEISEVDALNNDEMLFEKNSFDFKSLNKKLDKELLYEIDDNIERDNFKDKGKKEHKINIIDKEIHFKNVFIPIYILYFKFNDKDYKFLVNGLTGDIFAEPIFSKNIMFLYIALILLLILCLFIFYYKILV